MGQFNTDPPYANGVDTDNTLLYKIARQLYSAFGGGTNGGAPVVGIQETRTLTKQASEETSYTIPAGSVGYTIKLSVDFVGTHLGDDVTGEENATIADNPQPGNTLPAIPITRTAGKFSVIENRRP